MYLPGQLPDCQQVRSKIDVLNWSYGTIHLVGVHAVMRRGVLLYGTPSIGELSTTSVGRLSAAHKAYVLFTVNFEELPIMVQGEVESVHWCA